MAIELHIEPGRIVSPEEFVRTHPPYSIALDGYVHGPPFFVHDERGPYRNFNHHEAVDRSCTCAACEQVRRAVLLGIFELYGDRERPIHVWLNDCDQDICLATWILANHERAEEPLVRALTHAEDLLDVSGGAIDLAHDRELLEQMRWVFAPYTDRRPALPRLEAADMRQIIDEIHQRIDQFVAGKPHSQPNRARYRVLEDHDSWALVEVDHQHARVNMVADGINAAVELYARNGANYVYAIWRRSEYILGFPVGEILTALNRADGFASGDVGGWGGSDNIGGSPRGVGSKLTPAQVAAVVDGVVGR